MSDKQSHDWLSYNEVDKADADFLAERPVIIDERRTMRTIENDLERARRERDVWKSSRGGQSNYEMARVMVSALEKELSDAISNQGNQVD
jgi:hypothetical protein